MSSSKIDLEKGVLASNSTYFEEKVPVSQDDAASSEEAQVQDTEVKRALKPRHIAMIALGGTIGSGLFIGTSTPLSIAGPV
ncbi:hypothetical protein WICPIJ_001879, partial [Wickerhamomyces pijperi]